MRVFLNEDYVASKSKYDPNSHPSKDDEKTFFQRYFMIDPLSSKTF